MRVRTAVAVALGAVTGAGIRWALTRALGTGGIDVALLVVNLTGAALLGFVTQVPPRRFSEEAIALLGAGLCGALTTWSSLATRTAAQLRSGPVLAPLTWLLANLVLGVALAGVARALARRGTTSSPVADPGSGT